MAKYFSATSLLKFQYFKSNSSWENQLGNVNLWSLLGEITNSISQESKSTLKISNNVHWPWFEPGTLLPSYYKRVVRSWVQIPANTHCNERGTRQIWIPKISKMSKLWILDIYHTLSKPLSERIVPPPFPISHCSNSFLLPTPILSPQSTLICWVLLHITSLILYYSQCFECFFTEKKISLWIHSPNMPFCTTLNIKPLVPLLCLIFDENLWCKKKLTMVIFQLLHKQTVFNLLYSKKLVNNKNSN